MSDLERALAAEAKLKQALADLAAARAVHLPAHAVMVFYRPEVHTIGRFRAYLVGHGWRPSPDKPLAGSVWVHQTEPASFDGSLLLPDADGDYLDHAERFVDAVRIVAAVQNQGEQQVLVDIAATKEPV